jgi:circadian clock protein KaiC
MSDRPGAAPGDGGPLSTGVAGLDEILGGGLPGPRVYLVQGAPGTGKTTFGLQFLRAGLRRGEPVLYVSLSQSRAELAQIAASHGWPLDGLMVEELDAEDAFEGVGDQTIFQTADIRLDRTRIAVEEAIARHRPRRIVYDSLLEVRHLAADPARYRRELLGFKAYIADSGVAALLLDTSGPFGGDLQLEGLAHGIICLEKELPEYGLARRRVEVKKMRGVAFADGYHDLSIRTGTGIEVYPRIVPRLAPEAPLSDLIQSGVAPLDRMLGGGLEAGTTALVVGQAGTGKSTLASLYAAAALGRGEGVAMFLFEERLETFFRRSEGLGMNLRPHHASGQLLVADFNPAEVPPGEFSRIVQRAVDERGVRVVLIDSFTGYLSALPRGGEAVMQIQTLLQYVARRGVLSVLVVARHGLLGEDAGAAPVDVSFLGDCVLLLRMREEGGRLVRTITVVKKRHGPHDMNVRAFEIRPDGLEIRPAGDGAT